MNPNGMSVALTPFVPSLAEAVTAALRELLGIPTHLPVVWHERRVKPWQMEVLVGDVALRLHEPGSEPAWFTGERVALAPKGGASPALLRALERRLRHVERDGARLDALHAALQGWRPFAGIQDTEFRNVSDMEAILRVGFRCNQDCGFCWQAATAGPAARPARAVDRRDCCGWCPSADDLRRRADRLFGTARSRAERRAAGLRLLLQRCDPDGKAGLRAGSRRRRGRRAHRVLPCADAALSDLLSARPAPTCAPRRIRASLRAGMRVGLNCVVGRRNLHHLRDRRTIVAEFLPLALLR